MYAPYSDVTSAWRRLKSPATDLFAQELIELTKMSISNFSINGILGWVSTGDLKITLTKHTLGYVDSFEWMMYMFTYFVFVAP